MVKRIFDLIMSGIGLLIFWPILVAVGIAVWLQDFSSPLYVAPRAGICGKPFRMVKIRSMIKHADRTGVASTANADPRITKLGQFIRKYKIDELSQLWNVLSGDMSFVGPRPQVLSAVQTYTPGEQKLLLVRPGITDFSSIVFSDEGGILSGHPDPDAAYDDLIRPWKSRLGIFYVDHSCVSVDIQLIVLTIIAIFSRESALKHVAKLLESLGADPELVSTSRRDSDLRKVNLP